MFQTNKNLLISVLIILLLMAPFVAQVLGKATFTATAMAEPIRNGLGRSQPLAQMASNLDANVEQATLAALLEDVGSTPEQPQVTRTVIEGDYALATWIWGPAGGQTALARLDGSWQVISSGGGAMDIETLEAVGVPADVASILVQRDQSTWE